MVELSTLAGYGLPIAHFVCAWIYVGCLYFVNSAAAVGFGLFLIVSLQTSGLIFFLRVAQGESVHSFLALFFLIFVGANEIFLIVVGIWAGHGSAAPYSSTVAAAVAFGTFDFLINALMVVWTFVGPKFQGGGFVPAATQPA